MTNIEAVRSRAADTDSQGSIAETIAYAGMVQLFKRTARQYANGQKMGGWKESKRDLSKRANIALDTLYFVRDDARGRERFYAAWGEETQVFDQYLSELDPQIQLVSLDSRKPLNLPQTIIAASWVAWIAISPNTADQQRARLYSLSGYPKDTVETIVRNLGVSGALTGANVGILLATAGISAGIGLTQPFLGEISDPQVQMAVALSYGVHYGALALNMGIQNVRLLSSEVHNCSNVFATATYFLLEKFLPSNQRTRNLVSGVLPMLPFMAEEAVFLLSLLANPSVAAARNIGLAALNFVESGANEVWLRKGKSGS